MMWTTERDNQLVALRAQNTPRRKIAELIGGVTEKAVIRRAARLGLDPMRITTRGVCLEWTSDRLDILRAMWPNSSGTQIAAVLGPAVTRSSVIAKARRLGLEHKSQGGPRPFMPRRAPTKQHYPAPIVRQALPGDSCMPLLLGINQLRASHCRELISGLELYCGLPMARGSYCEYHAPINYKTD